MISRRPAGCEEGQGARQGLHRALVGSAGLVEVVHEEELGEVKVRRGAREGLSRRSVPVLVQGPFGEGEVFLGAARPARAPVVPGLE